MANQQEKWDILQFLNNLLHVGDALVFVVENAEDLTTVPSMMDCLTCWVSSSSFDFNATGTAESTDCSEANANNTKT